MTRQSGDTRPEDGARVAWITGASTGIGRALALRLAREGWLVAASARGTGGLATLVAQSSGRVQAFPLDVTDAAAVSGAFNVIESTLGPVTRAVLNAGTYRRDSATSFDAAAFRETHDVNVMGTVNCLAAAMPAMMNRRAGHIAVVASVAGYVGLPGAAAYGSSKAALINLTEALQPELAAAGVRLSLVTPGFVDTPLTRKNDFEMPFMIGVDEAVDHIMRGFASSRFETAFPWRMVLAMRLLAAAPYRLKLALTRRLVRKG